MPTYDYICEGCGHTSEIFHMMSNTDPHPCPKCNTNMLQQIGPGYAIIHNNVNSPSQLEKEIRNREDRARDLKNKPTQQTHSGKGSGRGKALGGQHFEVDKQEFIKAAAKDPLMVDVCQKVLKNKKK